MLWVAQFTLLANVLNSNRISLVQRRTGASAEKRGIHIGDGVLPLLAPGIKEKNLRKAACPQRKPSRIAVYPGTGTEVSTVERYLAFVGAKSKAEGSPDVVLEALTEKENVRSPETVILVARERGRAVDIPASESRLKIERHHVAVLRERRGKEEAEAEAALQIPGDRSARGIVFFICLIAILDLPRLTERATGKIARSIKGTFIRAVRVTWKVEARCRTIERKVMP